MKHFFLTPQRFCLGTLLLALPVAALAQTTPGGVRIGTAGTPNAAAVLDLDATGKGLLIPRMDSLTRTQIATPPDGLMVFQTDFRKGFWYAMSGSWLFIPDKARAGDNLGNHTATQAFSLNSQRLRGSATTALGDSAAQVELIATVPNPSAALLTRSNYSRLYSRTMLSGYGVGPYGQEIDYAVWGNAYRADGWGGIFSAGKPGGPKRWVGLAQHPGYVGSGGVIRIVDGSEGAGKVLTSNAIGYGTWQNPKANSNFDLGTFLLVGNGGSTGLRISNGGDVGIGPDVPRGRFDVNGPGNSYLVDDPNNGTTDQSVFLPGHLYLAPYSGTSGTAFIQARVPNPTASTSIGLTLRTTNAGNLVDALRLNANGSAVFFGTVTANGVTLTSDARFKQQVRPLAGALVSVLSLRGVRYRWNALGIEHGGEANAEQIGLLAQELEKVYPELVRTDEHGYKSVNYAQLTPVLIEAIKELKSQVDALQADNATLHQQAAASTASFEQRLRALEAGGARAEAQR
ncbi:MAG: tail fiber domain-containing protein [Janthinobacterium lividum]